MFQDTQLFSLAVLYSTFLKNMGTNKLNPLEDNVQFRQRILHLYLKF